MSAFDEDTNEGGEGDRYEDEDEGDAPDDLIDEDISESGGGESASRQREKEDERKQLARELAREDGSSHIQLDQDREKKEAERLHAELERKWGQMGKEMDEDPADSYGADSTQQNLLPQIKDPKLWLIKCDPGEEDETILLIFQKFLQNEGNEDERFYIKSAFTQPASKGYVYIEADKEIHVKRAIRTLRQLKMWKMKLVPMHEMVGAVSVKLQTEEIKPKQVRTTTHATPPPPAVRKKSVFI